MSKDETPIFRIEGSLDEIRILISRSAIRKMLQAGSIDIGHGKGIVPDHPLAKEYGGDLGELLIQSILEDLEKRLVAILRSDKEIAGLEHDFDPFAWPWDEGDGDESGPSGGEPD